MKKYGKNLEIPIDDLENKRKILGKLHSIDPEGCLDIDDAFHFKNNKDNIEIGIHIADVSRYVKPIKNWFRAQRRLTSIYTHKVINMLPSCLSEDICSVHKQKKNILSQFYYHFLKMEN